MSSPDPLTLPSSPLATRSTRYTTTTKPSPRAPRFTTASPTKSIFLDAGDMGTSASPWRIKVTVEAEPSGSPRVARKRRTTSVDLKQAGDMNGDAESERERVPRKRKATPPRHPRRQHARMKPVDPATEEDDTLLVLAPRMPSSSSQPAVPSPDAAHLTSTTKSAKRRRSLLLLSHPKQQHTQNSKRLSQAREELDAALWDAVGYRDQTSPERERSDEVLGRGNDDDEDAGLGAEDVDVDVDAGVMDEDEDFTMLSVEELEGIKAETSMVGHRGHEGEVSGLSISYLPSSPPKNPKGYSDTQTATAALEQQQGRVAYPNLHLAGRGVDWHSVPTPARPDTEEVASSSPASSSPLQEREQQDYSEQRDIEWRRARAAVSREIEAAGTSCVVVIEDDTKLSSSSSSFSDGEAEAGMGGEEEDDENEDDDELGAGDGGEVSERVQQQGHASVQEEDEDIWQEEASRSLTSSTALLQPQNTQPAHPNPAPDPPAQKPLRSKIPRTWRRSAGNADFDFAYSDSPAHEQGLLAQATVEVVGGEEKDGGAGSRASSGGVLTPPSSDEEVRGTGGGERGSEGSFGVADGVGGTPFLLREGGDAGAGDGGVEDTTGLFWRSERPRVERKVPRARAQRRVRAMDLSELLGLGRSSTVKSAGGEGGEGKGRRGSPLLVRAIGGGKSGSEVGGNLLPSGVARTALADPSRRQSRVDGSAHAEAGLYARVDEEGDVGESFASKASDQRQLLGEMAGPRAAAGAVDEVEDEYAQDEETEYEDDFGSRADVSVGAQESYEEYEGDEIELQYEDDVEEEYEDDTAQQHEDEPSNSYEEHLNLSSPQKIRVRFGDSQNEGNSSLLAPKRIYAPLFASNTGGRSQQRTSSSTVATKSTATTAHAETQQQQGLFTRLTATLWSALVRPTALAPPPAPDTPAQAALRARIRSRYGVVAATHPWTMTHMRTLHRMLNSCTSGMSDSIIPRKISGGRGEAYEPDPAITAYVGKEVSSISGMRYIFTPEHGDVVHCFLLTLVARGVVEAMARGEVEVLGDAIAVSHRGELGDGRWGGDLVWEGETGRVGVGRGIGVEFVVRALGDCVGANIGTERRAREREAREREGGE
ncbi:hypothetical protein LTR08_006376 [Meristemomyces frigidus]|nr:hypothetical protein LTR08_006376 [Meristemomyces frigidus]